MRSNEEFNIGGPGIDTQYERDYINYWPKIKYKQPVIDASSGLSVDTVSQSYNSLTEINESSVISVWEDVVDAVQAINKVEQTLAEKLKDVLVPVYQPALQKAIQVAAQDLGYSGITSVIPFALYKKTFEVPESDSSILIQETYEDYMSDVGGTLNGELYSDIAEIKNDWDDILEFINKGLFAQLVSVDEVPTEVSMQDIAIQSINEKEKIMVDEYAHLLRMKAIDEQIYNELYEREYGSERFFQIAKELEDIKRQIVNIEKRLFTKAEIVDLIKKKASDTSDSVELIGNSIDFDPYKEDKYGVVYALLKQFNTRDAMKTALKKIQAVLKLSVDGKKADTDSVKSSLRGIAGRAAKKETNQTLINGIHLRNEVFGEVYDIMKNLDGIPNSEDFDTIASHISDGIYQADIIYKSQASDFYKIHRMDSELRSDRLVALIHKDAARSAYKLMASILNYSENVNNSWPQENELSRWVKDFMENSNLT